MNIQELWANYRIKEKEVNNRVAASSRQPRSDWVYITSTDRYARVTEAKIWPIASRCLFEGTARLSSDAEIEAHENEMARRRMDRQSGVAAGTTNTL